MTSRLYETADYDHLESWWCGHWGHAPSVFMLPQSGLIINHEGKDRAAGWLYMDSTTSVSFMAWLVASPDNTPSQTNDSMKALISGLEHLARSQDRSCIITLLPVGGLSNLLQNQGYRVTDGDMEHLAKELK